MADYKTYLAASILTEDKAITYRLLSRALKVHVNAAKEMLYDFHTQQSAKKPGTVHATYLLSGTKRDEIPTITILGTEKDGEDDHMQSSPFVGSTPHPQEGTGETSILSITLVREEELDDVMSQYEHISSIHIYSLEPQTLKDLQVLSDVTHQIQELTTTEDPLEFASKYGTITNPLTKRRTTRRPPPVSAPIPTLAKAAPTKPKPADIIEPSKSTSSNIKQESKSSQSSSAKDFFGKSGKEKTKEAATTSNVTSRESTPKPPALKRDSSNIFKAFAKAKPKKVQDTDSSAAVSAAEDSPMKDVSDDDEETYAPLAPTTDIVDSDRKSRKAREAILKRMMEEEEENEVVAAPTATPEEIEEPESKEQSMEPKEEPSVEVSGGRRRGRRRVMKKKTVKDEEGYLVTKEEAVWESFSDDEPVAKPKPKSQSAPATKAKKPAAKVGQGNIMAFFGKK